MLYRFLADVVVVLHFAFILFALLGGLLALRWRGCAWIHLPVVLWSILIEWVGWVCPLTPLENWLLEKGSGPRYETGFIEHYILPVIYPAGLTRTVQFALGLFVLVVNLAVYGWVWHRIRKVRDSV